MENRGGTSPLIDAGVWSNLQSLEKDGNPGFLQQIIGLYLGSTPTFIEKLKSAVSNKNFNLLSETAHSFKSSCQSIGALTLADQLQKIESHANQSPPIVDEALFHEILRLAEAVVLEMKSRAAST